MADETLIEAARRLRSRGLWTVPVRQKDPRHLGAGWQNLRLDPLNPEHAQLFNGKCDGLGIVLGPSGVVDLEADCDAAETVLAQLAPPTGFVWHHAKRCHRLYVSDAVHTAYRRPRRPNELDYDPDKATVSEVRAGNHQSVVPPSQHPDGDTYEWILEGQPARVDGELLHRAARLGAIAGVLAPLWPRGARQEAACALAGWFRRLGITETEAAAVIEATARTAGDEETAKRVGTVSSTYTRDEGELITGLPRLTELFGRDVGDWLSRLFPRARRSPHQLAAGEIHNTDLGNSTRLSLWFGADLRHASALGWLSFNGKRWVYGPEGEAAAVNRAKDTVRRMYAEAENGPDGSRQELVRWALASESTARINAMLELARTEDAIRIDPNDLDRDRYLLNVANGAIELQSGELRPHCREDYCSRLLPVAYNPQARCPQFTRFLLRIMGGNRRLVRYLQRAVGYSLTGDVSEQCLFFCYGLGANGKSTLINVLLALLGDLADQAAPGLLLASKGERHPTERADLAGKRLVASVEVGEGKRMAEELVKQLTGNERIKGRFMRQDFFGFEPQFKLWLAANHKPIIKGTDWAIWRRIPLIPFTVTFTDTPADERFKKDPKLPGKLLAELPGILAWAVRGCLAWQREGLNPPPEVLAATAEYRAEMDVLGEFITDRCDVVDTGELVGKPEDLFRSVKVKIISGALYHGYTAWCEETGERAVTQKSFGTALKERGFVSHTGRAEGKVGRYWIGIDLLTDGEEGSDDSSTLPPSPTPPAANDESGDACYALPGTVTRCNAFSGMTGEWPPRERLSRKTRYNALPGTERVTERVTEPSEEKACARARVREPLSGQHTLIDSTAGLASLLRALEAAPRVAIDSETTGLDPRTDQIRLLSLATERGCWVVDGGKVSLPAILPALRGKPLLAHNTAFDVSFLMQQGLEFGTLADTMLQTQLLHAGRKEAYAKGFYTLGETAARELGIELPKELQKSDWSGELTPEQLDYAGRDAAVLLPLADHLHEALAGADLFPAVEIEQRALAAMIWMAQAGVPFNQEAWQGLMQAAETELATREAELNAQAPAHPGTLLEAAWNWNSPAQVQRVFGLLGTELEKTNDDVLASVDHPLAALLRQYRSTKKRLTTYGQKWLNLAHGDRLYPSWRQLGSVAGRMACSKPNVQQIPRASLYRSCIAAPPGSVLIKADYSQIELRIAAHMTNEARMIEAYRKQEDIHTLTARQLCGNRAVTPADRQLAKAVNFGFLYGMGADRFRTYAHTDYGLDLTEAQARQYRTRFFEAYPGLKQWHREVGKDKEPITTRTLTGRRRLEVVKFTEKLNTPVQGTGADGLKRAMALLYERRGQCPDARMVIACHDEIVIECPMESAPAAAEWLKTAMVDGMAALIQPVPVAVETKIAPTWGG